MRTLLSAAVVSVLSIGAAAMTNTGQITVLDTIQGNSYLAIQSVIGIFQRRNPDLRQYKIEVLDDRGSVVVVFGEHDRQADVPKKVGVRSGGQVEMSPQELSLLLSTVGQVAVLDTIQGSSYLAVQAAIREFQRHNLDLRRYKIEVVRDGDALVVIFSDKDRQIGTRGNLPMRPGFEVELNAKDLRVLRSNFVR